MGLFTGGAAAQNVYVGSTPAKAVYAGDVKVWPVFPTFPTVRVLLVGGGGGGGGGSYSAGGGAGGYWEGDIEVTFGDRLDIEVGQGGVGGTLTAAGRNGGDTSFISPTARTTAIGGGRGGNQFSPFGGATGGSGGGGTSGSSSLGGGGAGTTAQGFAGGSGRNGTGGGGGGAGKAGAFGTPNVTASNGGIGKMSTLSGTDAWYAAGGGGTFDASQSKSYSLKASGIGGASSAGLPTPNYVLLDGVANTGSGGGGFIPNATRAGNGGSGIAIVSYSGSPRSQDGEVIEKDGRTIHIFKSSGTLSLGNKLTSASLEYSEDKSGDVTFTAQSAIEHAPGDEKYKFECAEYPELNQEVGRVFTITFEAGDYSSLNCSLEDISTNIDPSTAILAKIDVPVSRVVLFNREVEVEYLIAGGGGGGNKAYYGPGGGAGGLLIGTIKLPLASSFEVAVGGGGAGGTNVLTSTSGGHSFLKDLTAGRTLLIAYGGGGAGDGAEGGAVAIQSGKDGGSGGGAYGSQGAVGKAIAGQGFSGGKGLLNAGGGGGGAAAVGGSPITSLATSNGGAGVQSDITGTLLYYAAGGGGNRYSGAPTGYTPKTSGIGGAASGGQPSINYALIDGTINTGSGGGGADQRQSGYTRAGNGGSGVVVLKYLGGPIWVGGTITEVDGHTIHTYKASGGMEPDPNYSEEPEVLTELRWKQIGPSQIEFTAWGGSGTYFYDFDGDGGATETNSYGEKVIVHVYKYTGYKTCTCMDMAGNANQQGVKVAVDLVIKSTWP